MVNHLVLYRATHGLRLVKRLRCSSAFMQKYLLKGVGISGKFDQYFSVTTDEQPPADFRKTCYPQIIASLTHITSLEFLFFSSLTPCDSVVVIT